MKTTQMALWGSLLGPSVIAALAFVERPPDPGSASGAGVDAGGTGLERRNQGDEASSGVGIQRTPPR